MFSHIFGCCFIIIPLLGMGQVSPVSSAHLSVDPIHLAKSEEIRMYMNASADPCDDFYEYTCGNYATHNPVDENNRYSIIYMTKQTSLDDKLLTELETENAADTDIDKQMKIFYRSCINIPEDRAIYIENLREAAKEFGGMPALLGDSWSESEFDWPKRVAEIIRKTDHGIIFEVLHRADFENNTINRVVIAEPPIIVGKRFFYGDKSRASARNNHMEGMVWFLKNYLEIEPAEAKRSAAEILEVEIALALALPEGIEDKPYSDQYTLIGIDELQAITLPNWDVKQFIGDITGLTPNEVRITREYVETVGKVLARIPKRAIANYVMFAYLSNLMYGGHYGAQQYCLRTTRTYFYKNLINLFYRKYTSRQAKEGLVIMWREIKTAFEQVLQSPRLNWMEEDTRRHALDKLKAMKMIIDSFEETDFAQEYGNLSLKSHNFVHNIKTMMIAAGNRARSKVNGPPPTDDPGQVSLFSPAYFASENAVHIMIGVLDPEYIWSDSYPQSYNFANLGFVVAHEIVHGFDDTFRLYDAKANLRDWWDARSSSEFIDRTHCLLQQYHNYVLEGQPLPNTESPSEIICDNSGLSLAYEAYLQWYNKTVANQQTENLQSFRGFNYTNKQMFFISYGHQWCAEYHSSIVTRPTTYGNNVPPKFRVIGPLSNLVEFSKVFNCPKGSAMNPETKCVIY